MNESRSSLERLTAHARLSGRQGSREAAALRAEALGQAEEEAEEAGEEVGEEEGEEGAHGSPSQLQSSTPSHSGELPPLPVIRANERGQIRSHALGPRAFAAGKCPLRLAMLPRKPPLPPLPLPPLQPLAEGVPTAQTSHRIFGSLV